MGKRGAGLNFFERRNLELQQAAAEQQQQTEEAIGSVKESADAMAEAKNIAMPSEVLAKNMAQPEPTPTEVTQQTPGPAQGSWQLDRPEVAPMVEPKVGEETKERLSNIDMLNVEQRGIFAEQGDLKQYRSEAEKQRLAKEQLGHEQESKAGMLSDEAAKELSDLVDAENKEKIQRMGLAGLEASKGRTLSAALDAGVKAFKFGAGEMNVFGTKVNLNNIPNSDLQNDPHAVLRKNSNDLSYILKGYDKLNMLEDPNNIQSEIRNEAGRAAVMALIIEFGNRLNLKASEVDKVVSQRQFDGALDRAHMGRAVAQRMERMLYPTADTDPTQEFTTETKGFGYKYRLTNKEQDILGQSIVQGFADSEYFDWIENKKIKAPDGTIKDSFQTRTTRSGEKSINSLRRDLRDQFGISGQARQVSLVPTDSGKLIGEGAYTQKQITTMLKKHGLTPQIVEGIDAMSSVAHKVSAHKLILMQGVLEAAKRDRGSWAAKVTKQSKDYQITKAIEVEREYRALNKVDPNFTHQSLGYDNWTDAAMAQTLRIMEDHLDLRQETLENGLNRLGDKFYYGYTAINNSSRMMITQTELNYQADKVARFIVDGAVPDIITHNPNSAVNQGFRLVLARSLVPKADKMTEAQQLAELDKNWNKYVTWGRELTNYTGKVSSQTDLQGLKEAGLRGNIDNTQLGRVQAAFSGQTQQEQQAISPPLQFEDAGLTEFLSDHGKDAWYFAMDALHEIARYQDTMFDSSGRAIDGAKFATSVKAEIDGNSNGAVIQALQMGQENILRKGGVIYSPSRESLGDVEGIEEDIRDDVFNQMLQMPLIEKDEMLETWNPILKAIKNTKGKVKELMKLPIMTSIYGKDPRFHQDTARQFINDNPTFFPKDVLTVDDDFERLVAELGAIIEYGLIQGLGSALEHASMAKRIGRAFNFSNQIAEIEGANGFEVQAGGWEYVSDGPAVNIELGPGANLRTDKNLRIQTTKRIASAAAEAKKKWAGYGKKTTPDIGSKLRNQFAVNATQNIDATIAQRTVAEVVPRHKDRLVMQIYDAFIGSSSTFADLKETSNRQFDIVNGDGPNGYNMLEKEREAFNDMRKSVKKEVERREKEGIGFDVGTAGEFKSLGDFLNPERMRAIISRDLPGEKPKIGEDASPEWEAKEKAWKKGQSRLAFNSVLWNYIPDTPTNVVTPKAFLAMFELAIEVLNIESDLNKMIEKTNRKRKKVAKLKRKVFGQFS